MTEFNPNTVEIWKPIPEWEDAYEVSDFGRVCRVLQSAGAQAPRILRGRLTKRGYPTVRLSYKTRRMYCLVHRLVAAAFHGPRPDGHEVNHINGVKTDNRAANLEYVTHKQNQEHASKLGLMCAGDRHLSRRSPETVLRGERQPTAKLNNEKVLAIRRMLASGVSCYRIAKIFAVSGISIQRIRDRKTWAHI